MSSEALRTTYWVPQLGSALARFVCGMNFSSLVPAAVAREGAANPPAAAMAAAERFRKSRRFIAGALLVDHEYTSNISGWLAVLLRLRLLFIGAGFPSMAYILKCHVPRKRASSSHGALRWHMSVPHAALRGYWITRFRGMTP